MLGSARLDDPPNIPEASLKSESDATRSPPLEAQKSFWNEWNESWRFKEPDSFMSAQREFAVSLFRQRGIRDARILDVGCGTGWLGNALLPFGKVWATDLSEAAVSEGQKRHPGVRFVPGDFLTLDLPGPFDVAVSADSINNIHDQRRCVQRQAELLKSGGLLLMMTPNRAVWRWRSALKPLGQGQVQYWRSLAEYKELLRPYFEIERVATLDPGGDSGPLWWVENRWVRGALGRVVGRQRYRRALEAARLGREWAIIAHRR
jgi:SAM-dependent methyltransferase